MLRWNEAKEWKQFWKSLEVHKVNKQKVNNQDCTITALIFYVSAVTEM